jgi:hypothetical protein
MASSQQAGLTFARGGSGRAPPGRTTEQDGSGTREVVSVPAEKRDWFDAREASLRQRLGTLQAPSGNGALSDRSWREPAGSRPTPRRSTLVSSVAMVAALLLGLLLGAALWRERAGAAQVRIVTQSPVVASPTCQDAVERLDRSLAVVGKELEQRARNGNDLVLSAQYSADFGTALADYRNMVTQCRLK